MKIAVVGAGGVGGYFGARLAAAGQDVTFIARGAHLAAIGRHGLRIESALGNLQVHVPATSDPASVGPVDCVWITVKLWDTEAAALAARPLIGAGTTVVSFQNGVEKEDVLRTALPGIPVMGGVSYIGATVARPGVIVHTGTMARLEFGSFDDTPLPAAATLLAACRAAQVDAEIPDDIRVAIWRKFIFLVALSAITTATRLPVGPVRANPRSRDLAIGIAREATEVARARGVPFPDELFAARLAHFESLPAEMTSSMHQDLKRGNRLELPWLSGAVVRLGEQAGVPTPLNRAIWGVLAPYQDGGHNQASPGA